MSIIKKLSKTEMNLNQLIAVAGLLYIISQALISAQLAQMTRPGDIFALQFSTSAENFFSTVRSWSTNDYDHYMFHYNFDFFHPFIYAALLIFIFQKKFALKKEWVFLLPISAAAMDLLENIVQIMMITDPVRSHYNLWYVATTASWLKWITVLASLVTAVVGFYPIHLKTNIQKRRAKL